MEKANTDDDEKPKRFAVEMLITHPTLDPAEISKQLGLSADIAHRVGDQRKTPKGAILDGTYRDTRWRHSQNYEATDQWFSNRIAEFLDCVEPHKAFFKMLRSTGGSACMILVFLGDGYFGDEIPREILARLVDMEIDIGIECFAEPKSE